MPRWQKLHGKEGKRRKARQEALPSPKIQEEDFPPSLQAPAGRLERKKITPNLLFDLNLSSEAEKTRMSHRKLPCGLSHANLRPISATLQIVQAHLHITTLSASATAPKGTSTCSDWVWWHDNRTNHFCRQRLPPAPKCTSLPAQDAGTHTPDTSTKGSTNSA